MLANFGRDLDELITDFPSELGFGGKSCACFISEKREEIEFNEEGEYRPESYSVLYRAQDLPLIQVRNVVNVDGTRYHVETAQRLKTGIIQLDVRRI